MNKILALSFTTFYIAPFISKNTLTFDIIKTLMKYFSKQAAIKKVRLAFSQTSTDIVSLEEIFALFDRQHYSEQQNTVWMQNILLKWKYHGLVRPKYAPRNGRWRLNAIQLTDEGKKLLDRATTHNDETVSFNDIPEIVKRINLLREKYPQMEITFDFKLKPALS